MRDFPGQDPIAAVLPTPSNRVALALVIATVAGFAFSLGLTYPVISLVLDARGYSETQIGLNSAAAGVGLLISAPILPRIARIVGYRRIILTSGVAGAAILVCMTLTESYMAWLIARMMMAAAVNGLFIGSEAWLNELVDDRYRGRVMGVYASVISGTFALGPTLVPVIGFMPPAPFLVCAAVVLVSGLLVLPLKRYDVRPPVDDRAALLPIAASAPILLFSVVAMGVFEAGAFALFPVYVVGRGFDASHAALMITALAAGGVILQPAIGWLADRADARGILLACAGLTAVLCLAIPALDLGHWGAFLLVGLLGGVTFGAYTLTLTSFGRRFRGGALAAAMACAAVAWGVGGTIGPATAGWSMAAFGNDGLMHLLGGIYLALAVAIVVRRIAWRRTAGER